MTGLEVAIVLGFIGLLAGALFGVSRLAEHFGIPPESKRKIIHVGLGLAVLTLPLLFDRTLPVAVLCVLSIALLMLARRVNSLGSALHDVGRSSLGDVYFAISVAVLFLLADTGIRVAAVSNEIDASPYVFFVVPILIMTLADTAAALTGTEYGRRVFAVEKGRKSLEGVVAFFVVAWLASLFVLLLATDMSKLDAILISMTLAFVGATIEAESWGGLDNLFVPMGLHVMLVALADGSTVEILQAFGIYAALTLLSLRYAGTYGRQPLRAAALVLTVTWIAFGFDDFSMVAVAMTMTLLANRVRQHRDTAADLQTVFAVVVLAVVWIAIGSLTGRDMILNFSTAIAVYGAIMAMLALRHRQPWGAVAVAVIGGMLFWRIAYEGVSWQAGALRVGVGAIGLVVVGLIGLQHPKFFGRHRALKGIGMALAVSAASMVLG